MQNFHLAKIKEDWQESVQPKWYDKSLVKDSPDEPSAVISEIDEVTFR